MKKSFDKLVSRRTFLRAAAATMAASTLDRSKIKALGSTAEPKSEYSVVVIGAGLGGLTAAAYLAQNGFPVTVLEQRDTPGGYATSFNRGVFNFEVSLHWTFRSQISQYLEELDINEKVEFIKMPDLFRLILPKYDLIFPQKDPEAIIQILSEKFPKEALNIRSFISQVVIFYQEYRKSLDMRSIPFTHPIMWSLLNLKTAQVINEHFKDSNLKRILFALGVGPGVPPDRLPGSDYALITGYNISVGWDYIKLRSSTLSYALMNVIKKHGGQVIFKTEAEKILTKDGAVAGVRTVDGKTYHSRAIISNASAPATFERMLSTEVLPEDFLAELRIRRSSFSTFVVWLGLNQEIRGKISGYEIFISDRSDLMPQWSSIDDYLHRGEFIVTIYDNLYSGYSPPGKSSITLFQGCSYGAWKQFEAEYFAGLKRAYKREKERIANILIKRAEARLIPGLRSMIEVMDVATPLTNIRYTRNPEGSIYGYGSSMPSGIKNRTPVKGLYLAGAWDSGGGYHRAMRSGRNAFRFLMEDWERKT